MRVLFVRHGESEANVRGIFANRGWSHPLTATGRRQANALADALAGRDISAIFSSPLQRAIETAHIIATRFNIEPVIEPALVEYHVGIYEGRAWGDGAADYDQVARQWSEGLVDARLPGGESCREIEGRVRPFIRQLIDRFGETDATILLVGHGGTYTHALPRVLGNLDCALSFKTRLNNAAYAEAELRDGTLRCVRWGEMVFD
jgi:probable phosphoglycerate mutase